jgi:hypothetical protein
MVTDVLAAAAVLVLLSQTELALFKVVVLKHISVSGIDR